MVIRLHRQHLVTLSCLLLGIIIGLGLILLTIRVNTVNKVDMVGSHAFAYPSMTPQIEQRVTFLAAEHAWQQGDVKQFHELMNKLTDYPLYPYLFFLDLSNQLDTLTPATYDNFVNTYHDAPLNKKLNQAWLESLAKQQQWPTFLRYYDTMMATENLTCYQGQALLATSQDDAADLLAEKLWLVPYAQPKSCDPLFAHWIGENKLTTELMWQRFILAIHANDISVAKHVMNLMPANQQLTANLWLKVVDNPKKVIDTSLFPIKSEANNDILTEGLLRLTKQDPKAAIKAWETLKQQHQFTHDQIQDVSLAIISKLMLTDADAAWNFVQQTDATYLSGLSVAQRLQLALTKEDWTTILAWSKILSPQDKNDPAWQYWEARALAATGQTEAAKQIWQQLAKLRNYYGFLAANKVGKPFALQDVSVNISNNDLNRVETMPGIARASELFSLQQIDEGNAEWWAVIDNLSENDRYVAAHLAAKQGWYSVALTTTSKVGHVDDLQIRFPTFYKADVLRAAKQGQLNPAYIFAIIRQESLFQPGVASGVGAQGLMQLMIPTVKEIIQKNNLPPAYVDSLTDPSINITLGGLYLTWLQQEVQSPTLMAAAYNAGIGHVREWLPVTPLDTDIWIDRIPFTQTRDYVKNVLAYAVTYQYMLGQQPSLAPFMPATVQKVEENATP